METPLPFTDVERLLGLGPEAARELTNRVFADEKVGRLGPAALRRLLEARGFRYPKRNLVFHCLKGGAAKTTLAYNTAYRLAQLGGKVLLVDLDKQGNATHSLGIDFPDKVFVDAVTDTCGVADLVVRITEHLCLVPSSLENARLEMELVHRRKNPRSYYRQLFSEVRDAFDFLVFDCPPDLSHNTYLCSLYADVVCIPTNPDAYSVHGTRLTLSSLQSLREEYEDLVQEVLVIWAKYDGREKSSTRHIESLSTPPFARVLPTVIRTDVAFKNAQAEHKSVFQLPRRSSAREDIDILAQELMGLTHFLDRNLTNLREYPSA